MILPVIEHRVPEGDVIDHDTTATGPVDPEQCMCIPRWTAGGSPHHIYALHRRWGEEVTS